jgi:hypothetical protein
VSIVPGRDRGEPGPTPQPSVVLTRPVLKSGIRAYPTSDGAATGRVGVERF